MPYLRETRGVLEHIVVRSLPPWQSLDRVFAGLTQVREPRSGPLLAENCLDAWMMDLPGADEESDLELGFTRRPTARKDDPAHVGSDSICEATVARQSADQVAEELVVAELEL
jgi:hypothetical protein